MYDTYHFESNIDIFRFPSQTNGNVMLFRKAADGINVICQHTVLTFVLIKRGVELLRLTESYLILAIVEN